MAALINAGVDVVCYIKGLTDVHSDSMVSAVEMGLLKEEVLNEAIERILRLWLRLGMYDSESLIPYKKITKELIIMFYKLTTRFVHRGRQNHTSCISDQHFQKLQLKSITKK